MTEALGAIKRRNGKQKEKRKKVTKKGYEKEEKEGFEAMKTSKNLIERVASFENLNLAYLKARRGKANSTEVQRFAFNLEPELFRLQLELLDGSYETGVYRNFTIFEPKKIFRNLWQRL